MQMSDDKSAITHWLQGCNAARLPASSTTYHHGSLRGSRGCDETSVLLCCSPDGMPNSVEDSVIEPKRRTTGATQKQPPRQQPPRGPSTRSQSRTSNAGYRAALGSHIPPLIPPPTNDPGHDFVSSTAELDISSSAQSEPAVSTQLTSVSSHKGGRPGSVRSSEIDGSLVGNRTRSRSPTKRVVDLSAARPPIRYDPREVPPEVEIILKRFKGVFKGRHLMPLSLKVRYGLFVSSSRCQSDALQKEIKDCDPDQFYETDDEFSDCPTEMDRKILKNLTVIRDRARNCSREAKPEPSWGCEVFKPLLDYAVKLENSESEQKVQVEDMCVESTWLTAHLHTT